jgi:hypothetical protein
MNARSLAGFGAVSIVVAALGNCATAPAGPPPGSLPPTMLGCDLASRSFRQTSLGACTSSDWRFTLQPDGSWKAAETGCANATGIARYDGATVTLDFQYGDGTGRYTWPVDGRCTGTEGKVTWFTGPLTGQVVASRLAPVPAQ